MISDVIVALTVLFALGWVIAWWRVPALRIKIEQPKYAFQEQLKQFDASRHAEPASPEETSHDPR